MAPMIIERIFPKAVTATGTLADRLAAEAAAQGFDADALLALLRETGRLAHAGCFLDAMTGLWRYEFGAPYRLANGQLVLGTHMWIDISYLAAVLDCAHRRLTPDQLGAYLPLLGSAQKHQDYLAEMVPMLRVECTVPASFEVQGRGEGNRTIDWHVGPYEDRSVLIDVKRRAADFREAMEALPDTGTAPPPSHDAALLFRSVEKKFVASDPAVRLQGAWISTDLKQDAAALEAAFAALDKNKVHFAIIGDAKPDAHVISRNADDAEYLRKLFQLSASSRFTFSPDRASD